MNSSNYLSIIEQRKATIAARRSPKKIPNEEKPKSPPRVVPEKPKSPPKTSPSLKKQHSDVEPAKLKSILSSKIPTPVKRITFGKAHIKEIPKTGESPSSHVLNKRVYDAEIKDSEHDDIPKRVSPSKTRRVRIFAGEDFKEFSTLNIKGQRDGTYTTTIESKIKGSDAEWEKYSAEYSEGLLHGACVLLEYFLQIERETVSNYSEGLLEGLFTVKINGKLQTRCNYKKGLLDGVHETFWISDLDKIHRKTLCHYKDGEITNRFEYYAYSEEQGPTYRQYYEDGVMTGNYIIKNSDNIVTGRRERGHRQGLEETRSGKTGRPTKQYYNDDVVDNSKRNIDHHERTRIL